MVNQSSSSGPKSITDKVLAIVLVIWLLFFGGFSQLQTWLTPARLSQVAQIADTIKTGAGRVVAPAAAPAARPAAAPVVAPRVSSGAPASPAAGQPAGETQAQIEAAADAAYPATAQASLGGGNAAAVAPAQVVPNIANPATWPTAVILVPTAIPIEQVTVVPDLSKPIVYASNSPPTTTPAPTLVYPTPLAASDLNMVISPDGKCVTATRRNSGGKRYQACQDWGYKDYEAKSTAEMLYTGLIPGVEVSQ